MKKLTALFLALALCLSLCTVTAFAGEEPLVDNITLTYEKLSIEQLKGLTTSDKMADIIKISSPTSLNSLIMENASYVYCYDAEGQIIFGYSFGDHSWYMNSNKTDVNILPFNQVAKVGYVTRIGANSDGFRVNFNTVSGTIFANGNKLPVDDFNNAISCSLPTNILIPP